MVMRILLHHDVDDTVECAPPPVRYLLFLRSWTMMMVRDIFSFDASSFLVFSCSVFQGERSVRVRVSVYMRARVCAYSRLRRRQSAILVSCVPFCPLCALLLFLSVARGRILVHFNFSVQVPVIFFVARGSGAPTQHPTGEPQLVAFTINHQYVRPHAPRI